MNAKRFLPAAAGIAMLLAIACAADAADAEAKPACGSSISACGCTINQSGTYTVVNDLNASQGLTPKGDCIDVAESFVQLNVQGATVIGNGTGVGIRVLGSAHHSIIEGGNNGGPLSTQAMVSGWDIGIMVNANNVIVELFQELGGTKTLPQGNVTAGLVLDGVTDCRADAFDASRNGVYGVLVKNANRNNLFNFQVTNNGGSGIQLLGARVDSISNLTAIDNRLYGILLLNSDQNQIFDFTASNNGASGVAFGCEINGTAPCPANRQPSAGNKVGIATTLANTNVGILINFKSSRNQIAITKDTGNRGVADLSDGNPDCARNQWFNNIFGTASPASCIH